MQPREPMPPIVHNDQDSTGEAVRSTGNEQRESAPRFAFGRNWRRFLDDVDEVRIEVAERSLREMLGRDQLDGLRFLDIGSGSGLFSLAARRLGAVVHSFDFDPDSVACTAALRERWAPGDDGWSVAHASILDTAAMEGSGTWDVVYSWGVLHHTGALWEAIGNAADRVASGGSLFIAIYNDQGRVSRWWAAEKRLYVRGPRPMRAVLLAVGVAGFWGVPFVRAAVRGRWWSPSKGYEQRRGMSPWTDLVDWMGGHPFEVATPVEIVDFLGPRGFHLERSRLTQRLGCNELVFERS